MLNPLENLLDKKWEKAPLDKIIHQSPAVLEGISSRGADMLEEVLGVSTIAELAACPYVLRAQALVTLAEAAD